MHTAKNPVWTNASGSKGDIGQSLLDCIGNTPLLRLERLGRIYTNAEFSGKAEWLNPGGSVKDRPALEMIRDAERDGRLQPGQTILDATSGNTGIAYAMIAAACGYRVKLCLPASASEERKKILAAYGAELVITPGDEGSDGAITRAREIITGIRQTGAPTIKPPRTKSGSRPAAG
jgi:cysteine synthase B